MLMLEHSNATSKQPFMVYVAKSAINSITRFYLISQPLAQSFETHSIYQDSSYHIIFIHASNFRGTFMQPHSIYPSLTVAMSLEHTDLISYLSILIVTIISGFKERKRGNKFRK